MQRLVTAFDDTYAGPSLVDEFQSAFHSAIEIVDDQLLEELASLVGNGSAGLGMFSDIHLPDRYRDLYDAGFLRRLQVCFIRVVDRLSSLPPWPGVSCRGEEFALNAVITQVRIGLEVEQPSKEVAARVEQALTDLEQVAFDDLDFEYAFDAASDGIDDPETEEGQRMGVASLHPSKWFEPFEGHIVHPLARLDDTIPS